MNKKKKVVVSVSIALLLASAAMTFSVVRDLRSSVHAAEPVNAAAEFGRGPAAPTMGIGRYTVAATPILVPESETQPEDGTEEYLLDVPLSEELQTYIWGLCENSGVPYKLVIALIECESEYQPDAISKTDDYGLMQINTINHETLSVELGVENFLDAKQNCMAGIYMLSEYYQKYENCHLALMAYNLGETGARRCWYNGQYTTEYSERVVAVMERLSTTEE